MQLEGRSKSFISGEHLRGLFQVIGDRQMLRTGALTLAALNAVSGTVAFGGGTEIIGPGLCHLSVSELLVHGGKNVRDPDLLGTTLNAVPAAGNPS